MKELQLAYLRWVLSCSTSLLTSMRFYFSRYFPKLALVCCLLPILGLRFESCKANEFTIPMLESEREALYSVIEALVGEWNGRDLYPDPCGVTPIQGTSCDQFGDYWYITVLNLGSVYDNSLKCSENASIHPAVFDLKHLKTLSFYMCFTSTPQIMPQGWERLGNSLQSLVFRNNNALVGEIPAALGELKRLELLIITENSMKGKLPSELAKLYSLRKLVLSHNQFQGSIPGTFGFLRNLLILDLSSNALTGNLPSMSGSLVSVMKMDLSDNAIRGQIPWEFGKLKNMTLLDLRNNELSGGLPRSLTEMCNLQELYLGNNPMGGNLSLDWNNLRNLMSLDLATSGYEGSIPESLGKLRRLRYIALNDNNLSGGIPTKLAELPFVNALYLNGNSLSGAVAFPQRFYERMGRRLALWNNNPGLCYVGVHNFNGPDGINPCSGVEAVTVKNDDAAFAGCAVILSRYYTPFTTITLILSASFVSAL